MDDNKKFELGDDQLDEVAGGCFGEPAAPTPGGYHPNTGDRVIAYCPYCEKIVDHCIVWDNCPDPEIHPGEYFVKCQYHHPFYTTSVEPAPPLNYDPFL